MQFLLRSHITCCRCRLQAQACSHSHSLCCLQDQAQWERQTLHKNLQAIQTPDPSWQPPDVRPPVSKKLSLREKMAADYVYQMTRKNIWYVPEACTCAAYFAADVGLGMNAGALSQQHSSRHSQHSCV